MKSYQTISSKDLLSIDQHNSIVLDVRTHMEHSEKHIALNHAHVPLDELDPNDFMMRHGLDREAHIYLLCRSGTRAALAAKKFIDSGYKNVKVVEGGISLYEISGHEMKGRNITSSQEKGPITLERQVRIAVGLITAVGAALGLIVNPIITLIPLLTGLGLIFAGITDRCGMALLLAKAPWNNEKRAHTNSKTQKTDSSSETSKKHQSCQ